MPGVTPVGGRYLSAIAGDPSPFVLAITTRAINRSGPSYTYGITGPTKAGHEYNKIGRLSREFPIRERPKKTKAAEFPYDVKGL